MSERTSGAATSSRPASKRQGLFARIALFIRQVVAELRKVVRPSRSDFLSYVWTVLAFVVFMMAIITGLDFVLGIVIDKIFH